MKMKPAAPAALLVLLMALGVILGSSGGFLSPITAKAVSVNIQPNLNNPVISIPDIPIVTPTPKIVFIPDLPILTLKPQLPTLPPAVTVKPETPTPKPDNPTKQPNNAIPRPTNKPKSSGQYMTSEGPLFLSFRADLTDELYMFTPMDLAMDGEYRFPLIGSSMQAVGEAKVEVKSGMAIVTYLVTNDVKVDEKSEFFTFFPDIRGVPSVQPSRLQEVKLRFGIPYSVAGWLNSDSKVLLYINCPVSYKTDLKGLAPFAFEDPAYIQRVIESLPLMD